MSSTMYAGPPPLTPSPEPPLWRLLPSIIFICAAFDAEQMCFAMYCTYWESGSGSVFIAAFSCLAMGPSEQRQYFTGGLTGSCESIYSLTAMRQNGPCERRACSQRPAHCQRARSVPSDLGHSLHSVFVFSFYLLFYFILLRKENDWNVKRHFKAAVFLSRRRLCCSTPVQSEALWVEERYCLTFLSPFLPVSFCRQTKLAGANRWKKNKDLKDFFSIWRFKIIAFWD